MNASIVMGAGSLRIGDIFDNRSWGQPTEYAEVIDRSPYSGGPVFTMTLRTNDGDFRVTRNAFDLVDLYYRHA